MSSEITVVALSGHVGAGKTTLAEALGERYGFVRFTTRSAILRFLPGTLQTRSSLQAAGESLDRDTGEAWVATALRTLLETEPNLTRIAVDAIRTADQLKHLREEHSGRVLHAHLHAPLETLEARYSAIASRPNEAPDYAKVLENQTERLIGELSAIADLVIDTSTTTVTVSVLEVAERLGL